MSARPAAKPDCSSKATKVATLFVRVPSSYLGMLLDRGRSSAYAIHLTAIKASKGPTFVLNEKHVGKEYRISRRAFQAAIRLMQECLVLERMQTSRRTFAVERFLAPASRYYVPFDQRLLSETSTLVAFILAVNLSPRPMARSVAAKRVGIKSPVTARNLVSAAVNHGAIATAIARDGTVLVARPGYVF